MRTVQTKFICVYILKQRVYLIAFTDKIMLTLKCYIMISLHKTRMCWNVFNKNNSKNDTKQKSRGKNATFRECEQDEWRKYGECVEKWQPNEDTDEISAQQHLWLLNFSHFPSLSLSHIHLQFMLSETFVNMFGKYLYSNFVRHRIKIAQLLKRARIFLKSKSSDSMREKVSVIISRKNAKEKRGKLLTNQKAPWRTPSSLNACMSTIFFGAIQQTWWK